MTSMACHFRLYLYDTFSFRNIATILGEKKNGDMINAYRTNVHFPLTSLLRPIKKSATTFHSVSIMHILYMNHMSMYQPGDFEDSYGGEN